MENQIFKNYPGLIAAFSSKSDGNLRIKTVGDAGLDSSYLKNRKMFYGKIGLDHSRAIEPVLEHNSNVAIVGSKDLGRQLQDVDAIITDEPGIFLNITVGDCLPIYVYDPEHKAIGLVHAGWRGLVKEIIKKAIQKMEAAYGSSPSKLKISIGPSICQKHYEVLEDVAGQFAGYPDCILREDGKIFLDLKGTAIDQLQESGVLKDNIEASAECTYEMPDEYFSFRRDKPKLAETMLAVLGVL